MAEVGAPISLDGVVVHLDCWCVCWCIFILHQKIQKMTNKDTTAITIGSGSTESISVICHACSFLT